MPAMAAEVSVQAAGNPRPSNTAKDGAPSVVAVQAGKGWASLPGVTHEHGFGPNDVNAINQYIQNNYDPNYLNNNYFPNNDSFPQ